MKFLKHILLFCCLLVLPLLSAAKSHATNSWVLDFTDIVDIPPGCAGTWPLTSYSGVPICLGNIPPTGTCSVSQTCKIRTSCDGATYSLAIYTCVASGPGPVNGTFGTANGGRFYTPPTTGLCDLGDGVATPAPTGTGPHPHSWTWTCGGSGGGSASPPCTATQMYDGVCGSSHYQFLTSEPTTNLCAPGFPASPVAGTGPWTWSCEGLNTGLTTNCTSRIAVNGSCGSADGAARSTAPSANLCGAGTPSSVTGTGPWNWTCDGTGVGTRSASCSAPLPPPPPSFGGACPS